MDEKNILQFIIEWYGQTEPHGFYERSRLILPGNRNDTIITYLGDKTGLEQIKDTVRLRRESIDVEHYEILEIFTQTEKTCVLATVSSVCKFSGRKFERYETHVLSLNEKGQVESWNINFDTASERAAFVFGINAKLLEAVGQNDRTETQRLLECGADPDARDDKTGLNALMMASGQGCVEIVRMLLDKGADVHTLDSQGGATALHKACHADNLEIFELLAGRGASVESLATTTAHTPLFEAIWFKCTGIVRYLLEKNVGLNLTTRYGLNLKMHFDETIALNVIGKEKLIRIGELLTARNESDEEMVRNQKLMAAVIDNDIEGAKRLIASGAKVDELFPVVNGPNDRHTPLLVACREGRTEIVAELLKAGADPNAVEPTFGAVPLHKAVYNGHEEITRMLVGRPGIDLDFQGATNRYTPLHDAIWHGYDQCAKIIVDAGARLDLKGDDGKLPLTMAIEVFGEKHELVKLIRSKTK